MLNNVEQKELELIDKELDPDRPSRLCVSLSDIHLTDGSVGFQNLSQSDWDDFYAGLSARCLDHKIKEMTFVIDGDVVDMIRTARWAEKGIYPWERERIEDFSQVVNEIIQDIVNVQHKDFFKWLRDLPQKLKDDAEVDKVKTVILVGNHDKELLCDQKALSYFYEEGLGQKLDKIKDSERRAIGRMYGDEEMFVDATSAPFLPFYYGDRGFRFFTTHGHWRDKDNSRKVKATGNLPAWSVADGWQNDVWKKLKFSPFLLPCFGDTVAAGVLSTFIYKVKKRLLKHGYHDDRLMTIIDELDLYRPTYKALSRILEETHTMRSKKCDHKVIRIIEDTLYTCIIDWLSWDFTYQSSPWLRRIGLWLVKILLKLLKLLNIGLEIKAIAGFMKFMSLVIRWNPFRKPGLGLKEMSRFPAFMPAYEDYEFQIHGEGHTHKPLQEDPKFKTKRPTTYINFGTWRDQIVARKNSGYRRRSVLRTFFIFDLKNKNEGRTFKYLTDDIISWSDELDTFSRKDKNQRS